MRNFTSATIIGLLWLYSCHPKYHAVNYVEKSESTVVYPFEVIHADGAFSANQNRNLHTFELVEWSDKIEVKEGILLLAHYSGDFYEFDPGSTVDVEAINLKIGDVPKLNASITRGTSDGTYFDYERPSLKHLYEDFLHDDEKSSASAPYLQFSHPRSPVNISADQELCLRWWTRNPQSQVSEYELNVLNVFNEVLDTRVVQGNTYKLSLKPFHAPGLPILYIVTVRETGSGLKPAATLGITIDKRNNHLKDVCDITEAVQALEAAYHLEYQGDVYGSLAMYEQATLLSKNPIYGTLLNNFKKRYSL